MLEDAVLHGYKKVSKGREYPIMLKSLGSSVRGKVLSGVDEASLKLIDSYEGPEYDRIIVDVVSNKKTLLAFAYAAKT